MIRLVGAEGDYLRLRRFDQRPTNRYGLGVVLRSRSSQSLWVASYLSPPLDKPA